MGPLNNIPSALLVFLVPVAGIAAVLLGMRLTTGLGDPREWAMFRSGGIQLLIGIAVAASAVGILAFYATKIGVTS